MTVIAIDGTFASGKGTLGKRLAAHYGLGYLDTGKLYRAVGYAVMQAGDDPDNAAHAAKAAKALTGQELDDPILKSGEVAVNASKVAVHPDVRQALFQFQRDFRGQRRSPRRTRHRHRHLPRRRCESSTSMPQPKVRAKRRHTELTGYGEDITFDTVLAQLIERDNRDKNRKEAPLKAAHDAHLLETSVMGIDEVFEVAVRIVDAVLAG